MIFHTRLNDDEICDCKGLPSPSAERWRENETETNGRVRVCLFVCTIVGAGKDEGKTDWLVGVLGWVGSVRSGLALCVPLIELPERSERVVSFF